MFFARSDWLLKPGIVSATHLLAFFWILHASFASYLRKKKLFGAGYPQVWYILKQIFTSVSVSSGIYLFLSIRSGIYLFLSVRSGIYLFFLSSFAESRCDSANIQHYSPPHY